MYALLTNRGGMHFIAQQEMVAMDYSQILLGWKLAFALKIKMAGSVIVLL